MTTPDDSPTIFSRIIAGELPGRFVYRDEDVVSFLTIAPIRPGRLLVVPREPIDKWTDLPEQTWASLMATSQRIGRALEPLFECERVAVILAGLEVPHCHVHLIPIRTEADLSFANADSSVSAEALDAIAEKIRTALQG